MKITKILAAFFLTLCASLFFTMLIYVSIWFWHKGGTENIIVSGIVLFGTLGSLFLIISNEDTKVCKLHNKLYETSCEECFYDNLGNCNKLITGLLHRDHCSCFECENVDIDFEVKKYSDRNKSITNQNN